MKRFEKMKFFGTIAIALILLSCAGGGGGDSDAGGGGGDSQPQPAQNQLVPDGKYRLSALVYEYDTSGTVIPSIQGDPHVTFKWLGNGKYTAISGGIAIISFREGSFTVDCSSISIDEITLDENGNVIKSVRLKSGCLPGSSIAPLKAEDEKIEIIENGIQHTATIINEEENVQVTATFMKI